MIQPLHDLFEKPMDRREFLGYIGAGVLAVVGVSGLMKALQQHTISRPASSSHLQADNYGSTPYGGLPKTVS
ncbi:MAG: hypothetical protein ABI221_02375 [Candidatus Saccharimonadales bacterium]